MVLVLCLLAAPMALANASDQPLVPYDLACSERAIEGASWGDRIGFAMAVGDFDGDGAQDLAIGAPDADIGSPAAGAVFILHGPITGPIELDDAATIAGTINGGGLGTTVVNAGDVDNDGADELWVAAPAARLTGSYAGRATLVDVPTTGTHAVHLLAIAALDGTEQHRLGDSIAVGDLDGDGYPDVAIGIPGHDRLGASLSENHGAVAVYLGPVTGQLTLQDADAFVTGTAWQDAAGWRTFVPGDLDADGTDDLVVWSRNVVQDGQTIDYRGVLTVLPGGSTLGGMLDLDDGVARYEGSANGDLFGWTLAPAGDLDGDGILDLLVGAKWVNHDGRNNVGAVYRMDGPHVGTATADVATTTWWGPAQRDALFGQSVLASDVDGDGSTDLVVGATGLTDTAGATFVLPLESPGQQSASAVATVRLDGEPQSLAGHALAAADLDANGAADLVVAALKDGRGGMETGTVHLLDTVERSADADDDGLIDGCERRIYDTDPSDPDSDGDRLLDGREVYETGTDPLDADTDGDTYADATELARGSDPNDPFNIPGPLGPIDVPVKPFDELPVADDLPPME